MRLAVVGLGKLGAPISACLAYKGFEVIGLDIDKEKVEKINKKEPPVNEPGLKELLQKCKKLRATVDYEEAVKNSEIALIIVPTPTDETGGFSLKFVKESLKEIAKYMKEGYIVDIVSTILPGSMDGEIKPLLEDLTGKRCGKDFGLCYNPEFVALGNVIKGFLNPDFVLIGESDRNSGEKVASIYKKACENNPPIKRMNFINAEITKLALNTYVTTKISYANMLARICEKIKDADVDVITDALSCDSRIGGKYLKGAIGYGGPCFPRDNVALMTFAKKIGADADIAEATHKFNKKEPQRLLNLIKTILENKKKKIGILGLSYKPDTDVIEESISIHLIDLLLKEEMEVIVYDPMAMEVTKKIFGEKIEYGKSKEEVIEKADVILIMTPWEEFKNLNINKKLILIDCWRIYKGEKNKIEYIALGRGKLI